MQIEVNGTTLWYDVDGSSLVPVRARMRPRPTVVLLHGGPGSYDHSYFKPAFGRLASVAQVVYLDLRDHGRSGRGDPAAWTFEQCADDVRDLCDAVGIVRPVVFGHSMGGIIAMLYATRHRDHAAGIVLQSTMARFDLERLVDSFRRRGGDEVAELARRDYGGEAVTVEEWAKVFAAFGPHVPDPEQPGRRIFNPAVAVAGMGLLARLDILAALPRITVPTLVCVGELDGPTPVSASEEIMRALRPGIGRIEVIAAAGHFPWLDEPEVYWSALEAFIGTVGRPSDPAQT